MSRFHSLFPFLMILSCIFGVAPASQGQEKPPKKKAWTILLYMAADNDLEDSIMDNIEELMQVGSNKDVNIIALVDRSVKQSAEEKEAAEGDSDNDKAEEADQPAAAEEEAAEGEEEEEEDLNGYTNREVGDLGTWDGAKLILIEEDHLEELADWGETNMGDAATLKAFVDAALESHPAQRYGLLLNDHGGGWKGICYDDSADSDRLSIPEIQTVLFNVTPKTGKLEFLGFDACLMGNFEVAAALAPYARFIIASEELVPGAGWNYVPIVRMLERHPRSTGAEVGEVIADSFRDYFGKSNRSTAEEVTLSVIDTDQIAAIEDSVNRLADALDHSLRHGGNAAWLKLARARQRTVEFGKSTDGDTGNDLFDLIHLATLAKTHLADAKSKHAADEVIAAVKAAVLHNVRGKSRPHSNGLSIYFPKDGENLAGEDDKRYADLDVAARGRWASMLQSYCDLAGKQQLAPMLGEVRATGSIVGSTRSLKMKTQVSADELDQLAMVIGQPTPQCVRFVGQMEVYADDDGLVENELRNGWYILATRRGQASAPTLRWRTIPDEEEADDDAQKDGDDNDAKEEEESEEEPEGTTYSETPVQLRRAGHEGWKNVILGFNVDFDAEEIDGDLSYVYIPDSRGIRQIELKKGDHIRPLVSVLGSNGKLRQVPIESETLKIDNPDDLRMKSTGIPPGEYKVGFLATNLAGDVEAEFVDITLKE